MTIGDVLATVAGILATGITLLAAITAIGLVFGTQARAARTVLETQGRRAFAFGLGGVAFAVVFGIVLASQPNGLIKLIGMAVLAIAFGLALLGSAGIAALVADRIQKYDSRTRPLAALWRAGALVITAGFLPIVGWFLIFPIALIHSLGAGIAVVFERRGRAPSAVLLPAAPLTTAASQGE
jgi:hypothetical protein